MSGARTYNQNHIARPHTSGRRVSVVLIDSTDFTALFGGTDSLKNFWHNLVTMGSARR